MGFEPTRAEPIGLAVQRLNHSATSSTCSVVYDKIFHNQLAGKTANFNSTYPLLTF